MKLTLSEKKLLVKLLENTVERFEPEDLVHMIRGPRYHLILDSLYDECFRKHIKYGVSFINKDQEMDDKETEIVQAVWEKVSQYLQSELDFD
jgi:hypothetical protein